MSRFLAATLLAALVIVGSASLAVAGEDNLTVGQGVFLVRDAFADGKSLDVSEYLFPVTISQIDGQTLRFGRVWVHRSEVLNTNEALEHYNHYLEEHPDDFTGHLIRGMVWREKLDLDRAI